MWFSIYFYDYLLRVIKISVALEMMTNLSMVGVEQKLEIFCDLRVILKMQK